MLRERSPMSKRGLYIGGHSKEYGSPKIGYVGDHPFGYLKAKKLPKKKQSMPKTLKAKLSASKKMNEGPTAKAKKPKSKKVRIRVWRSN